MTGIDHTLLVRFVTLVVERLEGDWVVLGGTVLPLLGILSAPKGPEAASVPADHRSRLHDDEGTRSIRPSVSSTFRQDRTSSAPDPIAGGTTISVSGVAKADVGASFLIAVARFPSACHAGG